MEKKLVIGSSKDCEWLVPKDPTVKGSRMRKLVGPQEGWEDYVMRIVEIEPNGTSFKHAHPWPHINYYIAGGGVLTVEGEDHQVKEGDYSYVPANEMHQWKNSGDETLRFICIVPKEGHKI